MMSSLYVLKRQQNCLQLVVIQKYEISYMLHCIKVSATLQDRPRADRCSALAFVINPDKPTFSESLIVPDYGPISFKNLKIVRESVIETGFAVAYVYVNSTPVPLRIP